MKTPAARRREDEDKRLALVRESYSELLDAVKHQDDKVGRLLTGLSFLTAASLSIAALAGADYVTRDFFIPPFRQPVALLSLGTFVVGIILAVTLLMAAFNAPLRLPGQARPSISGLRETTWANDVKGSPIYFYEVTRLRPEQWARKYEATTTALKRERFQALVAESHNLGVRATYKHERIAEATTVVVAALLGLILAATFTLIAASSQAAGPLVLTTGQSAVVGALLSVATFIQFHTRLRNTEYSATQTIYAYAVSAGILLTSIDLGESTIALVGVSVFGALASGTQVSSIFGRSCEPRVPAGYSNPIELEVATARRIRIARIRTSAITVAFAIAAIWCSAGLEYGWHLVLAVTVYLLLTLSGLVTPTLDARWRRKTAKLSRNPS